MAALMSVSVEEDYRLYGSPGGIDNPGENQHVDLCRLGALQIAGPLRAGEADLLLGRTDALQRIAVQRYAALARDDSSERARLIEAAAPCPPPMQRYRDQHIGAIEQLAPRARHPAAHDGRKVSAVLVFQRMHQRARHLVIAHR